MILLTVAHIPTAGGQMKTGVPGNRQGPHRRRESGAPGPLDDFGVVSAAPHDPAADEIVIDCHGPYPPAPLVRPAPPTCICEVDKELFLGCFFIAGFRHHEGMWPDVFVSLAPGVELVVFRERANPHDPLAVTLRTDDGYKLGYVPRGENRVVAALLDQGMRIRAQVVAEDEDAAPWERVTVALYLVLPGSVVVTAN
jgi:hypothetical protein